MKTIKLTQGQEAMVDDEDFEELSRYKWYAQKIRNVFYATSTTQSSKIRMHRVICNASKTLQVDHIDGNGLNNCRSNLRIVTNRQNSQNKHTKKSSIYPGVYWHKGAEKWLAGISINGKKKNLGCFEVEVDAYNAYLKVLKEIEEVCVREM